MERVISFKDICCKDLEKEEKQVMLLHLPGYGEAYYIYLKIKGEWKEAHYCPFCGKNLRPWLAPISF